MKKKLILIAIAIMLSSTVLFLTSSWDMAHDYRSKFFRSSRDFPTSGGEKMKVDW